MKRSVWLLALLLFIKFTSAQENYFVTVVKGSVNKTDGSPVKPGSKLTTADKVTMGSKESLLILLHPSKGRIVISPQTATASKDNRFVLLVKDFLQMNQQQVRLSSRTLDETPLSLEDYFRTDAEMNSRILLIDTLAVRLPRMYAAADNKENFFFLQLAAAKTANHKLLCRNNMLYITRDDILFGDSLYKKTDGQLNLGYIQNYSADKRVSFISPIEPVYISKEVCRDLILLVRKTLKGKPDKEILNEVNAQLYYQFGKPDELAVEKIYLTVK